MKIFLDDFTMYNDMESHLQKLRLCFQKCIYGIFKNDIGFYYFQRKEITRSKENTNNIKHATT